MSTGRPFAPNTLVAFSARSMASSRVAGGGARIASMAAGDEPPTFESPVVDMIEHSDSVRSGKSMAKVWAIIPPIDAPPMWARSMPRASSRPAPSAAMSRSV